MATTELRLLGESVIVTPKARITSSAPHLFGLMLLLTLEPPGSLSRRQIQALLFRSPDGRSASHNLRQLLYRIRRAGLTIDERGGVLTLQGAHTVTPIQLLRARSPEQRSGLTPGALVPLPGWAPKLPPAFVDWLDERRSAIRRQVVNRLAGLLLELEPDHVASSYSRAEALSMLRRQQEALDVVDRALRNAAIPHVRDELQKFRGRIERQPVSRVQPRLHGRQDCMAFLWDQWEQCRASARLVVLLGAPGMGKTRVADELSAAARLRGVTVIQHRCEGSARAYPLSLFAQVLPELRAKRGSLGAAPAHVAVLERLRPSNATSAYEIPRGESLQALRTEIQDALIDVIEAVSAEAPLLLIVDDAHLLDRSSAAILRALSTARNSAHLMVLACCRPTAEAQQLLAPSERSASFPLAPLEASDSRALLAELTGHLHWSNEHFETCLREAEGIPFYLNAISRVEPAAREAGSHGFDVQSLGASSYFSLDAAARLVLESCLLLGSLATLERLRSITELDEIGLIGAVRTLEERGVVSLVDDQLRGPHALLEAVILGLIPPGVLRLLRLRVASKLAAECEAQGYSMPLALAAAENWLAAGDEAAAVHVLLKCATHIAALAEPAEAVTLLTKVPTTALKPRNQAALLDHQARYAAAANMQQAVPLLLRRRLQLAKDLRQPPADIAALELRLVTADTFVGVDTSNALTSLRTIVSDPGSGEHHRLEAITQMLIIADADYDVESAHSLYLLVERSSPTALASLAGQQAQLVFQTAFGDQRRALQLATEITERIPSATDDAACRRVRRHTAYALSRLLELDRASSLLLADYHFVSTRGLKFESLFIASLLSDIALSRGELGDAERWFDVMKSMTTQGNSTTTVPVTGYYHAGALLAMLAGRYQEAESLIEVPENEDARMRCARYVASRLALRLRLNVLRGDHIDTELVASLRELYDRGRVLGGQDSIVEALWCALLLREGPQRASEFLSEYLRHHRRERGSPEWLLRHRTSADDAWQDVMLESPIGG